MRQILLSPEFQLYSPFFIITLLIFGVLLLILFVGIIYLIIKNKEVAIKSQEVDNETKSRKLLEKLFIETNNGGDTVKQLDGKTMFEDALKGVVPSGASGNQTKQVQSLMSIMQGLSHQSTGMVQKMRQLTLTQAASAEMASGAQIIESVDSHIQAVQEQFSEEAPLYETAALGNTTPDQNSLGVSPSVETPPEVPVSAEIKVDIPAATQPEVPAEAQPEVPISAEIKIDTNALTLSNSDVIGLLKKMQCVRHLLSGNGINPDDFSFQDLSDSLFEKLLQIFEKKTAKVIGNTKVCSEEEERILAFLLRLQTERNGGKNSTQIRGHRNVVLFFVYFLKLGYNRPISI